MRVISNMAMADYLREKALSSGTAQKVLTQSPLHAWTESPWNPARDRSDSGTADIGTYAHAMLLEGGIKALTVIDAEDWRTKAAKEARDEARAQGRLPILARKVAEVESMAQAARAFIETTELAGIFDNGTPEQTIIWTEDGLPCKARPDWLGSDHTISISYKTTAGSANPDAWIRTQLPQYDIGIVFYELAIRTAFKEPDARVITLVQEQSYPYSCSLIALSPAWQAVAEAKMRQAMGIWKRCLAENRFPAYPTQICFAEPKSWQIAEMEEREMADIAEHGIEYDPKVLFGETA